MSDEVPDSQSGNRSWFERLSQFFDSTPSTREDVADFLRSIRGRGILDPETMHIMEGAMQMAELKVRDVMTARAQMVSIRGGDKLTDFLPLLIESAHSRIPVLGEDDDEVLGILLVKDLLYLLADPTQLASFDVSSLLRAAPLVPESKRLDALLHDFRDKRFHMALVVNEYGSVAGLVTIEDVLEQIVGEIEDEHDTDEDEFIIQDNADGSAECAGLTPIEDFNEHFASTLSDEEFDTIGGLVLQKFGRLPAAGESVALGEFLFTVLDTDGRIIKTLSVTRQGANHDSSTTNPEERT